MALPDIAKLKAECGRNHYQQALLLMLQATTMPGLTPAEKHKLMEVMVHHPLTAYNKIIPTVICHTMATSYGSWGLNIT